MFEECERYKKGRRKAIRRRMPFYDLRVFFKKEKNDAK